MMDERPFDGFPAATPKFLADLAAHNDKAWFDGHRAQYDLGYVEPARRFVAALGPRLRTISPEVQFDPRINGSIFRINRDVRFSKDKQPYKSHLGLWFWHGDRKGWSMPGFWFSLSADRVQLGTGLHGLEGQALESFRQSVIHPRSGKALLAAVAAVTAAGPYRIGEKTRKLLPRGFAAEGPASDYLLYESLHAMLELPVEAALSADFVDLCVTHYRAMWPIPKWLLDEVVG